MLQNSPALDYISYCFCVNTLHSSCLCFKGLCVQPVFSLILKYMTLSVFVSVFIFCQILKSQCKQLPSISLHLDSIAGDIFLEEAHPFA